MSPKTHYRLLTQVQCLLEIVYCWHLYLPQRCLLKGQSIHSILVAHISWLFFSEAVLLEADKMSTIKNVGVFSSVPAYIPPLAAPFAPTLGQDWHFSKEKTPTPGEPFLFTPLQLPASPPTPHIYTASNISSHSDRNSRRHLRAFRISITTSSAAFWSGWRLITDCMIFCRR